jgi:hypothetical protein
MAYDTAFVESGGIIVSVAKWVNDATPPTLPGDYDDLGNLTEYTEEPKVTWKKHPNHRGGTETTDLMVPVKEEMSIKFTTDDITLEKLRMYYAGEFADGTTIYPLSESYEVYSVKIVQHLATGQEKTREWWKVQVAPGGAIALISHGSGDTDWAKLQFSGEILDDSVNHPTNKWGSIYVSPTT